VVYFQNAGGTPVTIVGCVVIGICLGIYFYKKKEKIMKQAIKQNKA